jgi:hypothetical protein
MFLWKYTISAHVKEGMPSGHHLKTAIGPPTMIPSDNSHPFCPATPSRDATSPMFPHDGVALHRFQACMNLGFEPHSSNLPHLSFTRLAT